MLTLPFLFYALLPLALTVTICISERYPISWELNATRHTTLHELNRQVLSKCGELAYRGFTIVTKNLNITSEEDWQAAFRESTVLPLHLEVRVGIAIDLEPDTLIWMATAS